MLEVSAVQVPGIGRPPSKGEITRSRVLEAAHALFLTRGFHGTSMREIATRAGVAVGGIYNHYPSKEALFGAVLDAHHPYHAILPALESADGETVEDFVQDAAQRIREAIAGAETSLLPLVFTELVEFQGRHLQQMADRTVPSLMAFGSRLTQRRGHLRALPLPVMLRTFAGLFISYLLTEMIARGVPALGRGDHDWFGGMIEIYLHGILSTAVETA